MTIDVDTVREAIEQSNAEHPEDPVQSMLGAGVDVAAINELIVLLMPNYQGKTAAECVSGATASGFELGVRSARIHDQIERADCALLEGYLVSARRALERIAGELTNESPSMERVRSTVRRGLAASQSNPAS